MAQNKSIFPSVFLALIIFFQGFQSIEGRYLKPGHEGNQNLLNHRDQDEVHGDISTINGAKLTKVSPPMIPSALVGATGAPPALGHDVDDFRPTDPGHSPGVGHSVHN